MEIPNFRAAWVAAVPIVLCPLLFASASVTAQQWLTVGASGQFADLQRAVDAAHPGDTILVEPGVYGRLFLDAKPLHVVAASPGKIVLRSDQGSALTVQGMPNGPGCVLRDLRIEWSTPEWPAAWIHDNYGDVALFDCEVQPVVDLPGARTFAAVVAERNADLWLADFAVDPAGQGTGNMAFHLPGLPGHDGIAALYAEYCELRLDRPLLNGLANTNPGGHGGPALLGGAGVQVRANAFGVDALACLHGGDGAGFGGDAVHLFGDPRSRFERCGPLQMVGGHGDDADGGLFARDGDHGQTVIGPGMVVARMVPGCLASQAGGVRLLDDHPRPGGVFRVRIHCALPRDFALLVAPDLDLQLGGVPGVSSDASLLDWSRAAPVQFGHSMGAAFPIDWSYLVPPSPALVGRQLGLQLLMGPGPGVAGLALGGGDLLTVRR